MPDVYGSGSITLPYQGMSGGESAASATSRIPRAPVATAANSGSGDFIDSLQDGFRSLTGSVPDRDPNVPHGNLPQPGARRQQEGWQTVFPVYTLPPNAVLSNAQAVQLAQHCLRMILSMPTKTPSFDQDRRSLFRAMVK